MAKIQMIATYVAHNKERLPPSNRISNGWFMKGQDHLTLRKGDPIGNIRMDCMTEETMTEYFYMLKFVLEKWITQRTYGKYPANSVSMV